MTLQTFRELMTQRPFKPFRLVMSSGQSYEVRHPEMAWLTRTSILVGIDAEEGVPAEFKICALLHVATVEPLNPTLHGSVAMPRQLQVADLVDSRPEVYQPPIEDIPFYVMGMLINVVSKICQRSLLLIALALVLSPGQVQRLRARRPKGPPSRLAAYPNWPTRRPGESTSCIPACTPSCRTLSRTSRPRLSRKAFANVAWPKGTSWSWTILFRAASWRSLVPYERSHHVFRFRGAFVENVARPLTCGCARPYRPGEVGPKDHVVWIGHSAGGQIGMTMALSPGTQLGLQIPGAWPRKPALCFRHGDYVGSARSARIICRRRSSCRHYYSADDRVLRWASKVGPWVAFPLGYRTRIAKVPVAIGANCMIRCFGEIEHPYWDVDGRVLDRILGETVTDFRPLWHSQLGLARWGLSLSELMCRALETECHISVEDPPKNK